MPCTSVPVGLYREGAKRGIAAAQNKKEVLNALSSVCGSLEVDAVSGHYPAMGLTTLDSAGHRRKLEHSEKSHGNRANSTQATLEDTMLEPSINGSQPEMLRRFANLLQEE